MSNTKSLLTLKLPRQRYSNEDIVRYISFKDKKISLDDEKTTLLLEKIPEIWNTEKDRLIGFTLFEDKTYTCHRKKDVYNFSIKDTEEKSYFFDGATEFQVNELTNILVSFYNDCIISEKENLYQSIIDSLENTQYIKQRLLQMRDTVLQSSDYMFNSDYTFKTQEDEQKWKEYRQQWRDIPQQDFWKNNDFTNFSLPVSPVPQKEFLLLAENISEILYYENIPSDYLEDIKQFLSGADYVKLMENFSSLLFKSHVLQSLSSLKIPLGADSADLLGINSLIPKNIVSDMTSLDAEDNMMVTPWEIHLQKIEEKFDIVNQQLMKYNLNFTISDIIAKIIEEMNKAAKDYELEEQAQELLGQIVMGEE